MKKKLRKVSRHFGSSLREESDLGTFLVPSLEGDSEAGFRDRMEVVTVLGAGLLVGTALTVIIPEGVNTLFSIQLHQKSHATSTSEGHNHGEAKEDHVEPHNLVGPPLVLGFLLMLIIDQFAGGHRKQGTTKS
ncbi:Zinc transporter ZIP9 [Portunus trituberculatus]|uniref:Zinc transporter ZIP9 n=1 Tax=Portunus trituberculatus TaxID=210409 RepID=A0A5B7F332_PORTR|nr:Zinc transporter ZIP9 [Portunus trituberculatus]